MRKLFLVFALMTFPAVAVAVPPCQCGPKCECAVCGCNLIQTKPTDAARYGFVYGQVAGGKVLVVCVGVCVPEVECFPTGFMGIKDGMYDCWRDVAGKPVMTRRVDCPTLALRPPDASAGQMLQAGGCANGQCQSTSSGRLFFRWR